MLNLSHRITQPTGMAPLKERRQQARLTLFSKALTNDFVISLSPLSHPSRTTRTLDKTCFIPISTRTDVYKFAFIPRTILDWNSTPLYFRMHKISPTSFWQGRKSSISHDAPAVTGSPIAGLLTEVPNNGCHLEIARRDHIEFRLREIKILGSTQYYHITT